MISFYSFPNYILHWKNHFFGHGAYKINYKNFKMYVRPRTYDFFTIGETMVNEDYLPTVFLEKMPKFETIVDLGANIGDFSVWAALTFRPKKLVAVEMEDSNYDTLLRNINVNKLNKVIVPVKAAVYTKNSKVGVKSQIIKGSMDMVDEINSGEVKAVTLRDLLDKNNLKTVDFLKIDIEGSEKFILSSENEEVFRKRIKYVFVETHTFLGADPKLALKYFPRLGFKIKIHKTYRPHHPYLVEALNEAFN